MLKLTRFVFDEVYPGWFPDLAIAVGASPAIERLKCFEITKFMLHKPFSMVPLKG